MIKIYRIVDNTNGNIYIGKTEKKYLCDRMSGHRYDYRNNGSCSSREIIKNGDYKIELIEETDDKMRERYWILNTECVNKQVPGRTDAEYYEDNKLNILNNSRKYYQDQREDRLDKQKKYNKNNKDKIKKYREKNIDKIKKYDRMRSRWTSSMGGRPYQDNMSLLKIDPNLFLI